MEKSVQKVIKKKFPVWKSLESRGICKMKRNVELERGERFAKPCIISEEKVDF